MKIEVARASKNFLTDPPICVVFCVCTYSATCCVTKDRSIAPKWRFWGLSVEQDALEEYR